MSKKKSYSFILKVDTDKVDKKYDISLVSNIYVRDEEEIPKNTTKLSELITDNVQSISFLDEAKKIHKCSVSIINFDTDNDHKITYHCFWDRHQFTTKPIGCPINYISNIATKKYYSEISKDTYTINENIPFNKYVEDNKIKITNNYYYETDGVFCSFNCVMAFILDNKHEYKYFNSINLLTKMYNDMLNSNMNTICPAPHWRLLNEYGGTMTIQEFRSAFNKIDYENHGYIYPRQKSVGILYEQKLKF